MADDNLIDFETFLGISRGRWNGEEPPKPPSPRAIAKLGDELERAERDLNQMRDVAEFCGPNWAEGVPPDEVAQVIAEEAAVRRRYFDAELAYIRAVHARLLYDRVKFIRRKTPPCGSDAFALKDAMYDTRVRSDMLHDLGDTFSSRRERIDADCAACQAENLFEIAQAKYQNAERFERRTGIRKRPRSRVRLVTDGYVTTGKYKMIDGARVPVLEKVQ
jgi:hypothetical protein